jgi:hypothetical protein
VLERQAVQPQRNRDAADEGGVVLADQEHFRDLPVFAVKQPGNPSSRRRRPAPPHYRFVSGGGNRISR